MSVARAAPPDTARENEREHEHDREHDPVPAFPENLRVRQLVLQPTPFCNIDCRYCYLPARRDPRRMSLEVVRAACRRLFESPFVGHSLEIVWHAGEPLVLPVEYYGKAFAVVRDETPARCRVRHAVQTNGTLVDDRWCDFFLEHGVRVGLSVDGPARFHDRQRVTRSGRGTHEQVMRAANLLNRRGVPFSAIAVLTADALRHPDELHAFFDRLGARSVGFNIEETEAAHVSPTLAEPGLIELYARFMRRMLELAERGPWKVRELEAARRAILNPAPNPRASEAAPLDILSVDVEGGFASFSPELLGVEVPGIGPFRFGNVLRDSLADLPRDPRFRAAAEAIARGVRNCRESCQFFDVCGGGAPANKLFENGAFDTAETLHCATKIQVNTLLVLDRLEANPGREPAEVPPPRRRSD